MSARRICDAVDRHAHGVGLDFVVGLQAHEHGRLGAAVELLQVDADAAVEAEQVGSDGLAGGVGHAHAAQAQRVAQRPVHAQGAQPVQQLVGGAHRLAVHQRRADAARQRHEAVEEPALHPAGVFHADHHRGQQAFEDPRRREVVGRADLLQVDRDRAGRLRTVDDVAADQPLRVGEDVLPDPRRRQVGQHLLVLAQLVEAGAGRGAVDQREVGMHHALRVAGGARGEEHRRHVAGLAQRDLLVEELRVRGVVGAPGFDQRVQRLQAGLVVLAQAARVVEPDVRDLRAGFAQLEELVHLLLVLDHGHRDLGVVDREDVLVGRRVLVKRHRYRAQRLRRQHHGRQARPVVRHHHDVIAALQPGPGQAAGQLAHQHRQRRPRQALPDAVFLLAQCGRVGAPRRVFEHQPGKGRLHRVGSPVPAAAGGERAHCRAKFDAKLSLRRQSKGSTDRCFP